jgi:hypothetical protein
MTVRINDTIIVDTNRNVSNLVNGSSISKSHFKAPSGTTGQRPLTPQNGMIRYNTTTSNFEGYVNSNWGPIGSAPAFTVPGPIQLFSAEKISKQTTSSTTYQLITDLSVTISPNSLTNRIRIQAVISASTTRSPLYNSVVVGLYRNNTTLLVTGTVAGYHSGQSGSNLEYGSNICFDHLDTPNTTSPVTYNFYFLTWSGVGTAIINSDSVCTPRSEMIVEEFIFS